MGDADLFSNVGANIAKGDLDAAVAEIMSIAGSARDAGTLLSCASVLKAIGEADGFGRVVDMVMGVSGDADPHGTALSLSGLGLHAEALSLLEGTDDPGAHPVLYARSLLAVGRAAEAAETLRGMADPGLDGSVVLSEALCALGRHDEAISLTGSLVAAGMGWPAMRAHCGAMMHKGDGKGAFRYARKVAREAGGADSNALAAYVMRVNGRIPAAAGYAARALKEDPHHVGALEEMAMCLLEKGEVGRARYFAGAINDVSPGHPAAVRILDACPPRRITPS